MNADGFDADEIRFIQLVTMFQMAAMQQMGKLVNPVTNEMDRNLDQARASIDLLEMLKRRSEGNRTAAENEFLDKVLFELHMNYVDEVKGDKGSGEDADRPDDQDDGAGGADAAPTEDVDSEK